MSSYLVTHYCPAGKPIWTIECHSFREALALYGKHAARWPETSIAFKVGMHTTRETPAVEARRRLEWERSMFDVHHGRDRSGYGLPMTHPEAARAWAERSGALTPARSTAALPRRRRA